VRQRLEQVPTPDADAARERARAVVLAAYATREPAPRTRRVRTIAVAAVLGALAVGVAAASPPGMAVVDRVREVVGIERSAPALFSLPAPGRLLVASDAGVWVVDADGQKRLLAGYRDASWSPFGRFVVATTRNELAALEPDGDVRWTLARAGVRSARWGGTETDTRIAYVDRTGIRVVAGDGTGDLLLAPAERGPLAWRPGAGHALAYVSASEVRVEETDTGRVLWRANRGPSEPVRALAWSDDGRRLLVVSSHALQVLGEHGRTVARAEPDGTSRYTDAAFVPGTHRVVVLRNGSDVYLLDTGSRVFVGPGLAGVTPSPNGRWLLVPWPRADQWVFVGPRGRLRAVADVTAQFRSRSGFPRVGGWCCAE
jgi:hypothetical protein